MDHRASFLELRYGFLLVLSACSANPAEPGGDSVLPGPAPSGTLSAPSNTNAAGSSSSSSSSSSLPPTGGETGIIIIPPAPAASAASTSESPASGACSVAILGDPGFNPGANFAQWINERGPVVDRYVAGPDAQGFTLAQLSTYQVLLLDRLAPETIVGITSSELQTWVEGGGRVIALSGYGEYEGVVTVQNQLLEPLGLGFVSETPSWGPITQFAAHPITAGLDSLTFVGGRAVTHAPTDTVIMSVGDVSLGDMVEPVGVVASRGAGRLFLFGDEWVTFDSEWAAMPEIELFWVNVFEWLGGCKLTPMPMVN